MNATPPAFDPTPDLRLERVVPVAPRAVWRAWTEPALLERWFCPRPWRATDCEIDLRPGGRFRTMMRGPQGEQFENVGCYLEIVPERKLVFTDALRPDFRPSAEPFFTGVILLAAEGSGTHTTAIAMHRDAEARQRHADMGFAEGWGKALEQLVEVAQSLRS